MELYTRIRNAQSDAAALGQQLEIIQEEARRLPRDLAVIRNAPAKLNQIREQIRKAHLYLQGLKSTIHSLGDQA